MDRPRAVIVGAGVIGLGIAWKLLERDWEVRVLDRDRAGRATSWRAAGMLAPAAEIEFEELALYRLNRESLRRWPRFAEELEAASGVDVDYRTEGTFSVADDRDSAEALRRLYEFQREHEVPVEWLSGQEALEAEPFLRARLSAAVYSPEDHQVDNRRLVEALVAAIERSEAGEIREHVPVRRCLPDPRTPAVATEGGERVEADAVVLAMGPWAQRLEGLPEEAAPPIRPVKGQVIQLQRERPFDLQHVVRGPDAYLAPKSSGRIVVGATSEERGFDERVTAGGLYRLLEGAWEVVPGIEELPVTDTWVGFRPASRDHKPLIGWTEAPGVAVATGHYRHGILLTPVTAEETARLIDEGEDPGEAASDPSGPDESSDWLEPFRPQRFGAEVADQRSS